MSDLKPQSPEGKRNAELCEEAERIFDAVSEGKLRPEDMQAALSRCRKTVSAPEALPIRDALIELVEKFMKGNLTFDEFDVTYGQVFHSELPSWGLSDKEVEALAEVDDRLQWTVKGTPTPQDRADGFMSREQFREWLVDYWQYAYGKTVA
jgi:hypothetical protein